METSDFISAQLSPVPNLPCGIGAVTLLVCTFSEDEENGERGRGGSENMQWGTCLIASSILRRFLQAPPLSDFLSPYQRKRKLRRSRKLQPFSSATFG